MVVTLCCYLLYGPIQMSEGSYQRPLGEHRIEIIVVNSRFVTSISKATNADEARAFIARIRGEMPTANHHVYAFRAGYGNSVTEGMSDDGEPSGTSGPPTLSVLRGADIGDIVLVTTRFFGGTKLGTGGLVRAYTQAAQTALERLPIELKQAKEQLGIDVPYALYERVKRLLESHNARIDDEIFAGDVSIIATLLQADSPAFQGELQELSAGRIEPVLMAKFD